MKNAGNIPPVPYTPFLNGGASNGRGRRQNIFLTFAREGVVYLEENIEKSEKFEKITRTKKYKNIRKKLIEQLERDGNDKEFYIDLVDDYMDMWVTKSLLVTDIKERGVRVQYDNGGGQKGYKKNESIEQRLKVNGQMLKILSELNISPLKDEGGGEDDEL